jgi:hypothetical protein
VRGRRKRSSRLVPLLLALVTVAIGFVLYAGWQSVTIIADTTAPVFMEGTTCGYVPWRPGGYAFMGQTGLPVIAYIRENIGLKEVKAKLCVEEWAGLSLRTLQEIALKPVTAESFKAVTIPTPWGIPIILPLGEPLPGLVKLVSGQSGSLPSPEELESWPLYTYGGVFTCSVEANKKYIVVYTAVDTAGNVREFKKELIPTYLTGYVTINGKKVGVSDVITVQTLKLDIRFYAENEDMVFKVYGRLNGKDFEMKHQSPAFQQGYWQYIVELPGDGKYVFEIRVVDKAGVDIQFASFTVNASGFQTGEATLYALAASFGIMIAVGFYIMHRRGRRRSR